MFEIRIGTTVKGALAVALTLIMSLAVIPAAGGQSEPSAPSTPEPRSVPGEFLVSADAATAQSLGFEVVAEAGFGWTLVRVPKSDLAPAITADSLATSTGLNVEPNYLYELFDDDPLYGFQWSLENTGQSDGTSDGTSDADIDIKGAWPKATGDGVVIAVLDTGVDLDHVDVAPNLWNNVGETPSNGMDDDGNGYVDDINGWNMFSNNSNPDDFYWHGTFVATTALAPENGVGMVGVAPDASVMAIRVCGFSGPDVICPDSDILEGIEYAVDNGADVINLSLGGFGASLAIEQAISEAVAAGVSVVAAAGNYGLDNDIYPIYPASYDIDGLISVAATDNKDELADFSNYGDETVHLAAPGHNVVGGILGSDWGYASGTSFAAPKVSGVVALIKSVRPDLSAAKVSNVIVNSVDSKASLSGKVASGGRLNAASAVALACPLEGANGDDLLLYRGSGSYQVVNVELSGCVVSQLKVGTWAAGWTHIEAVDLDGDGVDEVLFYRKSDGRYVYYELNSGSLGTKLADGYWGSGWDSVEPVNLSSNTGDELLFYRKSDGRFGYYNLTSQGVIGSAVRVGYFGTGWTTVEPVAIHGDDKDEMLFYRKSDGRFAFYNLTAEGTIGSSIRTGWMAVNWGIIEPTDLDADNTDELVFYRTSDGRYAAYDLNPGGFIGSSLGVGYYWINLVALTSPAR